MGRGLGGTGGWSLVPPKFEVGDGPCIRPPNILRSTVIGSGAKYKVTEKGVKEEYFCLKSRFLVKKRGSYMLYIRFQTVETKDSQWPGAFHGGNEAEIFIIVILGEICHFRWGKKFCSF